MACRNHRARFSGTGAACSGARSRVSAECVMRAAQAADRANRFRTVVAYHCPPRAVRMPRRFSSPAIPNSDVTPSARIADTTGSTCAMCRSASALAKGFGRCPQQRDVDAPIGAACNVARHGNGSARLPGRRGMPRHAPSARAAFDHGNNAICDGLINVHRPLRSVPMALARRSAGCRRPLRALRNFTMRCPREVVYSNSWLISLFLPGIRQEFPKHIKLSRVKDRGWGGGGDAFCVAMT